MTGDLKKLQGSWLMMSLEMEGQKYPTGGARIEISGDRFVSVSMGAEYEGTVVLDETADPKTFDLTFDKGPEKGNRSLGIYELDGDSWKICLGLTGKQRPARFATAKGAGHALEVLEREKNPKKAEPIDEKAAADPELDGEWQMVSCMQDGKPMDARFVKSARRVFRGNGTTLFAGTAAMMKSRFTVDRSQAPHAIDYHDLRQHGIFAVTGGKLQTAVAPVNAARPTDFTATLGDGRTVSEWRRK